MCLFAIDAGNANPRRARCLFRERASMNGHRWLRHFEENRRRPSPHVPPWIDGIDRPLRAVLVASLQRFQLGETSEGSLARQAESAPDPVLDSDARAAIALFVREEGRHARELAELLRALGAAPIRKHWSETLFRRGRRLLGFRTKLLTVAAAEVVGAAAYALMAENVPSKEVADFARCLAEDEAAHLDFLADWMRSLIERTPHAAITSGVPFVCVLSAAILLAAWDHRALWYAIGSSPSALMKRCVQEVVQRGAQTSARAVRSGRETDFASASLPS
jgi:rubrerythrin